MPFFERDTHFAKHVIVRLLGVGRTAEVYEVVAPDGEHRALKVSKPGLPLPSKPQIRLGQEGEAIASIEHVNVVRFYDAGVEDGRVWLLLELVVGPNLQQLVELCGGTLAVERAVSLVRQACEGVAAAHALGILHRDLKPENILVAAGDRALVADFGSAHVGTLGVKTTAREQDLSSSLYTAPERMLKQCARHGRRTGGESPLGTVTEGTHHQRDKGRAPRGPSSGSLRCSAEPSTSEAPTRRATAG
jgi:serine/threonine protein kinase